MGDEVCRHTHEDRRILQKTGVEFETVINDYNKRYDMWGFKDPTSIDRVDYIQTVIRNPYWIVVLRDPQDVALSENRHTRKPVAPALRQAQARYKLLQEFINRGGDNILPIEFNILLEYPKDTVKCLAEYCTIDIDPRTITKHSKFLERGYKTIDGKFAHGRLETDD